MVVNPLAPVAEFYLFFFSSLPHPFRAYLNAVLGFTACMAVISLIWKAK